MGFICIASPAAADEASEALLAEGESADVDADAAASAPTVAAATTAAAAAPAPASLPVSAPVTTSAAEIDFFGGQSEDPNPDVRIGCRAGYTAWQPACFSATSPFIM